MTVFKYRIMSVNIVSWLASFGLICMSVCECKLLEYLLKGKLKISDEVSLEQIS